MAFKKFDFSQLDTEIHQEDLEKKRRAALDERLFGQKPMKRTTIDLTWERRASMSGDITQVGFSDQGKTIEVLFEADRADAFQDGLGRDLQKQWTETCDDALEAGTEAPGARDIARRIIAEGIWKPRRWKTRAGEWRTDWVFVVAQWHYTPFGRERGAFTVEGRLPGAEIARESAA